MAYWNTRRRKIFAALFHPISLLAFFYNCLIVTALTIGFKHLPFSLALIITVASYALYYIFWVRLPTEMFYSPGSHTALRLLAQVPCLRNGGYKTSFWTMNRHINTLWGVIRPIPDTGRLGFHREIAHNLFADGENCVLDWYKAPAHLAEKAAEEWNHDLIQTFSSSSSSSSSNNTSSSSATSFLDYLEFLRQMKLRHPGTPQAEGQLQKKNPVIVVFHGLTTAYGDNNITRVIHAITREGWDAVVPVRRGCGDDPTLVTKPKYYAYGGLEDTAITIEYIAKRVPEHPLFAVGFSAGSNVMVNYLGTQGRFSLINGAVSFANGFCWQRGTETIEKKSPIWNVAMAMLWKASVIHPHAKVLSTTHTNASASSTAMTNNTNSMMNEREGTISGNDTDENTSNKNIDNKNKPTPGSSVNSSRAGSVNRTSNVKPITEDTRRVIADVDGNFESDEAKERDRLYKLHTLQLKELDQEDKLLQIEKDEKYAQLLREAASIREIDDLISKEIHGFDSLDEFYAEQSCVHRLHRVKVPVVFCNAMDDPIASADHFPRDALKSNENFLAALTPKGGHLGWSQGGFPFRSFRRTRSWMDDLTIQSLRALMNEAKVRMRRFSQVTNNEGNVHVKMTMMSDGDVERENDYQQQFQQQQQESRGRFNMMNVSNGHQQQQQNEMNEKTTASMMMMMNDSNNNNNNTMTRKNGLVPDNTTTTSMDAANRQKQHVSFSLLCDESSQSSSLSSASKGGDDNAMMRRSTSVGGGGKNNSLVPTQKLGTPLRHVATPTMTIPREVALFPRATAKKKQQQQQQQQEELQQKKKRENKDK